MLLSPTTKQIKTVSFPDQIREICGLLAIHWAFDPSHSPHFKILLSPKPTLGTHLQYFTTRNHASASSDSHTAIPFTCIWTQSFAEFHESALFSGASRPSAFCIRKPNNCPRCRTWWGGVGSNYSALSVKYRVHLALLTICVGIQASGFRLRSWVSFEQKGKRNRNRHRLCLAWLCSTILTQWQAEEAHASS